MLYIITLLLCKRRIKCSTQCDFGIILLVRGVLYYVAGISSTFMSRLVRVASKRSETRRSCWRGGGKREVGRSETGLRERPINSENRGVGPFRKKNASIKRAPKPGKREKTRRGMFFHLPREKEKHWENGEQSGNVRKERGREERRRKLLKWNSVWQFMSKSAFLRNSTLSIFICMRTIRPILSAAKFPTGPIEGDSIVEIYRCVRTVDASQWKEKHCCKSVHNF